MSFVFVNNHKISVLNHKDPKRLQASSNFLTFGIIKIIFMLVLKLGIGDSSSV